MTAVPALYSARPAVLLDGAAQAGLSDGLLAAVVEETSAGLYRCEATFGNWGGAQGDPGYLYNDRKLLDFGKTLSVRMGAGEREAEVFTGRITGIEARYPADRPPEVTILAEDRFQDLRMTRRTRTFEDLTAADVVRQVASAQGIRTELDLDGPRHPLLTQLNQSDLAFLRDVVRRVDAELWMAGGVLHAQSRARRTRPPVTVTYGRELREISVLADLAGQRTAVSVCGWDVSAKDAIDEEATARSLGAELDGARSGISILQSAFGERRERIVHAVPLTSSEASAMADTALRHAARRFVTATALTEGDGRLRVGGTVEVLGLGAAFTGRHQLTRVRHEFDPVRGYLVRVELERPGLTDGQG